MKNLLYKQLEKLTVSEKKKITNVLFKIFHPIEIFKSIPCPYCESTKTRKNGNQYGIQRYKCGNCAKNYRLKTGTAGKNLKKPEHLKSFIPLMIEGYSLIKCAEMTGVSVQTAFMWKHKILDVIEGRVK
jgi:transposase-like protein